VDLNGSKYTSQKTTILTRKYYFCKKKHEESLKCYIIQMDPPLSSCILPCSPVVVFTWSSSLTMQKPLPKDAVINNLLNDLRDWFSQSSCSGNRPFTAAMTNCGCWNTSKEKPYK
jgi:hypothetical protein